MLSFAASWTKGHVTMETMRDDPSTIYSAVQNGIADTAAGAGAKTAGRTAQRQLLDYYARKQVAYITLMRAIVAGLVRVGAEVHRRRDAAKKAARGRGAITYIDAPPEPERPSSSASGFIVFESPPPFQGSMLQVTRQLQLQVFCTSIYLNPLSDME